MVTDDGQDSTATRHPNNWFGGEAIFHATKTPKQRLRVSPSTMMQQLWVDTGKDGDASLKSREKQ